MITAAALCPSAPLLVPELAGARPALPEVRDATAKAVAALLDAAPDLVAVVGAAPTTGAWPADTPVDFGPFRGEATISGPALPFALALGAVLLRDAGFTGATAFHGVAPDAAPDVCAALGRDLAATEPAGRVALLVVADGSACRSLAAPGWFDARAEAFDAATERAVRTGELDALLDVDPDLAAELQAAGRPAWQVLAGAAHGLTCTTRIDYADAPFGVGYLVAGLRFDYRRRAGA